MKQNLRLLLIVLISTLAIASCTKRINCDNSDEQKLGNKEFIALDELWNIEDSIDILSFLSPEDHLIKLSRIEHDSSELRVNDHLICEEIDIKPYKAYAYYEYPRLDNLFGSDSTVLSLEPRIIKNSDSYDEYLFINYAYGISEGIKAAIPVSDGNTSEEIKTFVYYQTLNLQDSVFKNVWYYHENSTGIIYSQEDGIVALVKNNQKLKRQK